MDTNKDKEGDAFAASDAAATATAAAAGTATSSSQSTTQLPTPANPRASSPAPSTTSSTGRPPYLPQFSAATQMILKRVNSKPGSLSSALSSASSVTNKTSIEKSTFEDAKRRLIMTMNTSLTMPMPAPMAKATPPPKTPKSSTSSTLPLPTSMPMNDAFNLRMPAPGPSPIKPQPVAKQPAPKVLTPKAKGKRQRGTKRKRGKNDDEATSSSLSNPSDEEDIAIATTASAKETQAVHTMTKSGRQVQKPSQYNPSQQAGRETAQKRKNYGKRTPEQALCKVCTRGLSPAKNQIVFCDGCNCCWHQLCHEPYIDDDFVSNQSRSWFCRGCVAKREKHLAKKTKLDTHKGVSWAAKSIEQKRSYLAGVPHAQLVNLIIYSTELHPDLPIFPAQEPKRGGTQGGRPSYGSPRVKADGGNINVGPTQYTSKVSTPDSHSLGGGAGKGNAKAAAADQTAREDSEDSVPPAWPKVGQGVLTGLEMDEDDLRDENDYEAFSVTTYDNKGKKIRENGMSV